MSKMEGRALDGEFIADVSYDRLGARYRAVCSMCGVIASGASKTGVESKGQKHYKTHMPKPPKVDQDAPWVDVYDEIRRVKGTEKNRGWIVTCKRCGKNVWGMTKDKARCRVLAHWDRGCEGAKKRDEVDDEVIPF